MANENDLKAQEFIKSLEDFKALAVGMNNKMVQVNSVMKQFEDDLINVMERQIEFSNRITHIEKLGGIKPPLWKRILFRNKYRLPEEPMLRTPEPGEKGAHIPEEHKHESVTSSAII